MTSCKIEDVYAEFLDVQGSLDSRSEVSEEDWWTNSVRTEVVQSVLSRGGH